MKTWHLDGVTGKVRDYAGQITGSHDVDGGTVDKP